MYFWWYENKNRAVHDIRTPLRSNPTFERILTLAHSLAILSAIAGTKMELITAYKCANSVSQSVLVNQRQQISVSESASANQSATQRQRISVSESASANQRQRISASESALANQRQRQAKRSPAEHSHVTHPSRYETTLTKVLLVHSGSKWSIGSCLISLPFSKTKSRKTSCRLLEEFFNYSSRAFRAGK